MGKLEGKITIVTGAASGIGQACAELFSQEGANVDQVARQEDVRRTDEHDRLVGHLVIVESRRIDILPVGAYSNARGVSQSVDATLSLRLGLQEGQPSIHEASREHRD